MKTLLVGCLILVFTFAVQAGVKIISITNHSNSSRINEPVVIPWKSIQSVLDNSSLSKLRLVDEQTHSLAFQVDDLDADGSLDELSFVANLNANQTRKFFLTTSADTLAEPKGPLRTDAANYKKVAGTVKPIDDDNGPGTHRGEGGYSFDGVGWESELVGYRLYLDERNAVDIQGKHLPGLQWNYIGSSGTNYQLDSYWGMDVLHIGSALGVGGIGVWQNDTIVKPNTLEKRHTRIIARGPVRVVVRVDYTNWDVAGEKIDLTSQFTMYAGDRVCEHSVTLQKGVSPKTIVTGIVKHGAQTIWNSELGYLFTLGKQSRANDSLFMAINIEPSNVLKRTEDKNSELLLMKLEKDAPLKILISARWQGEQGAMWNEQDCIDYLKSMALRLSEPLNIEIQ